MFVTIIKLIKIQETSLKRIELSLFMSQCFCVWSISKNKNHVCMILWNLIHSWMSNRLPFTRSLLYVMSSGSCLIQIIFVNIVFYLEEFLYVNKLLQKLAFNLWRIMFIYETIFHLRKGQEFQYTIQPVTIVWRMMESIYLPKV